MLPPVDRLPRRWAFHACSESPSPGAAAARPRSPPAVVHVTRGAGGAQERAAGVPPLLPLPAGQTRRTLASAAPHGVECGGGVSSLAAAIFFNRGKHHATLNHGAMLGGASPAVGHPWHSSSSDHTIRSGGDDAGCCSLRKARSSTPRPPLPPRRPSSPPVNVLPRPQVKLLLPEIHRAGSAAARAAKPPSPVPNIHQPYSRSPCTTDCIILPDCWLDPTFLALWAPIVKQPIARRTMVNIPASNPVLLLS